MDAAISGGKKDVFDNPVCRSKYDGNTHPKKSSVTINNYTINCFKVTRAV